MQRGTGLAGFARVYAALLVFASSFLARAAAQDLVLPPPPPAETSDELESPRRSRAGLRRGPWTDPVLAEIAETQRDEDHFAPLDDEVSAATPIEEETAPPRFELTGYFEIGGSELGLAGGIGAQLDVWPAPAIGIGARIGGIEIGPLLDSGDQAGGFHAEAIASMRVGSSAFAFVPSIGVGPGWFTELHHESCFIAFAECTPTTTHIRSGVRVLVPVAAGLHFRFRRFTVWFDWRTTHIHGVTTVHALATAFGASW